MCAQSGAKNGERIFGVPLLPLQLVVPILSEAKKTWSEASTFTSSR